MTQQEPIVYLNGELKPESQAGISIRDRGYLYGDAVFDAARTFLAAHVFGAQPTYFRTDPPELSGSSFPFPPDVGPSTIQKAGQPPG